MTPILVTGAAGFIGNELAARYVAEKVPVVGIDNLNAYYDPALKIARLARIEGDRNFRFVKLDLDDADGLDALFREHKFETIIHMAAQAGVRYSLENPRAYTRSNIDGFLNILECCRHHGCRHLVYASSSSVYGAVKDMPFSVHQNVDHPLSLYAATKKANELMAHSYSHLFRIPTTGLRFFTVYGPWGRPDMALFLFTRAILAGSPISVFNNGAMKRDFTYIDDVVEAVYRLASRPPTNDPTWNGSDPDPSRSSAPYRLYNIGNRTPVPLTHVIELLERALGKTAKRDLLPMQPGDVPETFADIRDLEAAIDWHPTTSIEKGLLSFVAWYRGFYGD